MEKKLFPFSVTQYFRYLGIELRKNFVYCNCPVKGIDGKNLLLNNGIRSGAYKFEVSFMSLFIGMSPKTTVIFHSQN